MPTSTVSALGCAPLTGTSKAPDSDGAQWAGGGLRRDPRRHSGWGVSLDQRVAEDGTVFGRFGKRTSGRETFDRAITVGFELAGSLWGREDDGIGVALGSFSTDDAYERASADGTLTGSAASGQERLLEVFYRYALNSSIEISPDFQMVRRPGGDPGALTLRVLGGARLVFGKQLAFDTNNRPAGNGPSPAAEVKPGAVFAKEPEALEVSSAKPACTPYPHCMSYT